MVASSAAAQQQAKGSSAAKAAADAVVASSPAASDAAGASAGEISVGQSLMLHWHVIARQAGFRDETFSLIVAFELPMAFLTCLAALRMKIPADCLGSLMVVEYFAGVAAIARAFQAIEVPAMPYDIKYHPQYDDLCDSKGFMKSLLGLLHLPQKSSAFAWFATVCGTWVIVSRSSTQRSPEEPLGQQAHFCVTNANTMVARCALMMAYCMIVGIGWALEQPSSSLMPCHPALSHCFDVARSIGIMIFETKTYMGLFGNPRPKETIFWSNRFWITALERTMKGHSQKFESCEAAGICTKDASGGFTGGPKLKETEAYPDAFGVEVAKLWLENELLVDYPDDEYNLTSKDYVDEPLPSGDGNFACANLEKMLRYLSD